jgi:hypothetical protein
MDWESGRAQSLGEDIGAVFAGVDLHRLDGASSHELLRIMVRDPHMLVLESTHRVLRKSLRAVVVKEDRGRLKVQFEELLQRAEPFDEVKSFLGGHKQRGVFRVVGARCNETVQLAVPRHHAIVVEENEGDRGPAGIRAIHVRRI